jgi:hypothetical protein
MQKARQNEYEWFPPPETLQDADHPRHAGEGARCRRKSNQAIRKEIVSVVRE